MYTVSVAWKAFLSVLVALALLAGALFIATPRASANLGQCQAGQVCIWLARNFEGQFSYWPQSSWGCHNHAEKPQVRSWANFSQFRVQVQGAGVTYPGVAVSLNEGYITGDLCWPI